MLDPRIYRAAFVPVVLAIVALAFSLGNQRGPLGSSLAPDAFNGQNAWATMTGLSRGYPNRRPGSASDDALAGEVARIFTRHGFAVATDAAPGRTADGVRTLETVTATRPGFSSRAIVVVAHRDSLGTPATSDLSGTGTLLEMARVLSGRTLKRTVILASTSGSAGGAGALQLAHRLAGSVDAVLVLGDLAGDHLREPFVVPWSDGQQVAPPEFRNTIAAALGSQANVRPGSLSLIGQFAHLAVPLATSEQGAFGAHGEPALLLSSSGDHTPAADEAVNPDRLTQFGRAALQTVSALEDNPPVSAPSAYLVYDGKVIPAWAIRVLVLALLFPVLATAIDGYARARRRHRRVGRWLGWALVSTLPFVLVVGLVLALRWTGLLHVAPPEPLDTTLVPLHTEGIATLISIVLVLALSFVVLARVHAHAAPSRDTSGNAIATGLVMCAVTFAIWVQNPFAAALAIPAVHLWMWATTPQLRMTRGWRCALVLIGIAPVVLVAAYYALTLDLPPAALAWSWVLMLAGGHLGVVQALEWSVVLGCAAASAAVALQTRHAPEGSEVPITIRGPATYAGPGSLGGTESALRR